LFLYKILVIADLWLKPLPLGAYSMLLV